MTAGTAADAALSLRDQALAALDAGSPSRALDLGTQALIALGIRGPRGGLDEAAVLIARAEIEEAPDPFGDARVTIIAATAILADSVTDDADDDNVTLWCQAQERMAGLERLAGDFGAAAARLSVVLDQGISGAGRGVAPGGVGGQRAGRGAQVLVGLRRRGSRIPAGVGRRSGDGGPGSAP